jgi:hypothetical protein
MPEDCREGYLKGLAKELAGRGLVARVVRTPPEPAFCRVVNPRAAGMSENVTCGPAPEASEQPSWYFWWSWGEQMHGAGDPCGAAVKVARVLEAHRG